MSSVVLLTSFPFSLAASTTEVVEDLREEGVALALVLALAGDLALLGLAGADVLAGVALGPVLGLLLGVDHGADRLDHGLGLRLGLGHGLRLDDDGDVGHRLLLRRHGVGELVLPVAVERHQVLELGFELRDLGLLDLGLALLRRQLRLDVVELDLREREHAGVVGDLVPDVLGQLGAGGDVRVDEHGHAVLARHVHQLLELAEELHAQQLGRDADLGDQPVVLEGLLGREELDQLLDLGLAAGGLAGADGLGHLLDLLGAVALEHRPHQQPAGQDQAVLLGAGLAPRVALRDRRLLRPELVVGGVGVVTLAVHEDAHGDLLGCGVPWGKGCVPQAVVNPSY